MAPNDKNEEKWSGKGTPIEGFAKIEKLKQQNKLVFLESLYSLSAL